MNRLSYAVCVSILCLVYQFSAPSSGFAQGAWVAPKGTGSIAVTYENNFDDGHSFGNGENYQIIHNQKITDGGRVRTQAIFLDLAYSITDRLALTVDVPYMQARYYNPKTVPTDPVTGKPYFNAFGPHKLADGSIPIDNEKYHGGFQDLGFRLRYNLATRPFMITPFMQYNVPSHAYPYYSHAVIGNRVAEFQIGSYAGGTLGSFLPNAYVQGGYGLGFPQRIMGISRIHHHFELEGGYFITDRWRAFGILLGQVTDGGLNFVQDPASYGGSPVYPALGLPGPPYNSGNERFNHHLQIQRDSFLDFSLGAQYSLNDRVDLYGVFVRTITNRNLHIQKYGLTFGFAWGFGGSPQRPCHC